MRETVTIEVGGDSVELLPERAAWWPRRRTLIVADMHLGKEQAFATLGIGVPTAVLEETLERLGRCVAESRAARVLIVGDVLHARHGLTPPVIDRVAAWRATLDAEIGVVPGNHDRDLSTVAAAWGLSTLDAEFLDGPFRFVHEPDRGMAGRFTWAGHLHPAVAISGGRDALRLPCFRLGPRVAVLPAFSRFTGRSGGAARAHDRLFATDADRVFEVPSRATVSR
ncbi:MAG: ligase-associated DNA damage response endonuclease PdeM [Phycisphaerales bacterium JB041]